jgi:hypothetical protein
MGNREENKPNGRAGGRWGIILKWILDCEGVDWIHLAQDRVQWQAVVNTVMNPRVP